MSLLVCFLSQAKSTACLLKDLIFRSIQTSPCLFVALLLLVTNMLSLHILLYSLRAQGFAVIALTVNEPRMYNPSKDVTLLKATFICP